MINRVTPERINTLQDNEIFVFDSNEAGIHGAGAAKQALQFGAQLGMGFGRSGQTYAIPTKDRFINTLSLSEIKVYVDEFIEVAKNIYVHRPNDEKFLVTAIGCGLAGYSPKQIAPLFIKAIIIPNIWLPLSFWEILNRL